MWKFGTEAAQFPEKEYINGIFVAVCVLQYVHLVDFQIRKKIAIIFNVNRVLNLPRVCDHKSCSLVLVVVDNSN